MNEEALKTTDSVSLALKVNSKFYIAEKLDENINCKKRQILSENSLKFCPKKGLFFYSPFPRGMKSKFPGKRGMKIRQIPRGIGDGDPRGRNPTSERSNRYL